MSGLAAALSPIVLGAMDRRGASPETREALLRRAFDLGFATVDVAPLYDFGGAERILGRALRGRRDAILVATKIGLRWDGDHGRPLFAAVDESGRTRVVRRDSRPLSVRRDVEESLLRLGIDHLDLVQVHHPDVDTPVEATVEALLDLRKEGKLRWIGLSNHDVEQTERAARALGEVPLACLQLPFSPVERAIEDGPLPWARSREVPVLAYSPLGEGILAGKYLDQAPTERTWSPLHHPDNAVPLTRTVREVVVPIAERHGVSPAAVTLAWVRAQPGVWPIVGVSQERHLEAAVQALALVLAPDELERIGAAFAAIPVNPNVGERRRDRALRLAKGVARRARNRLRRLVRI